MASVEDRIGGLESKVDVQLTEMNLKLDRLLNKVATCDDLAKLDDKLDNFKKGQAKINRKLESQNKTIATRLATLEDKWPLEILLVVKPNC